MRWWGSRRESREADVWHEGFMAASTDADEFIEAKDDFIAKQEQIIVRLIKVVDLAGGWKYVQDDLSEELRSYV